MKEISFLLFSNSCVKVQRSSLREVCGTWGGGGGPRRAKLMGRVWSRRRQCLPSCSISHTDEPSCPLRLHVIWEKGSSDVCFVIKGFQCVASGSKTPHLYLTNTSVVLLPETRLLHAAAGCMHRSSGDYFCTLVCKTDHRCFIAQSLKTMAA